MAENVINKNPSGSRMNRRTNNCNALLQYAMKRIHEVKGLQKFKSTVVDRKLQISTHLIDIEEKIQNRLYVNIDQYLEDLKRMTFDDLLNDKQLLRKANQFYTACETDGYLIKGCAECYHNEVTTDTDEWFTETCSTPHLIVSTKYGRQKNFPAKVISFDKENVFVRLFYEMEIFDVLYEDCFLYSNSGTASASGIKLKAMKDANRYIENVIKKFGHYNYGDTTSPITAQNIALHLHNMTLPSAGSDCILVNKSTTTSPTTKRIKLENDELPNADDGQNDVDDMDSTMGNVGDDVVDVQDDMTDDMPTISNASSTTRRHISSVQIHRLSTTSVRSVPPILKDYTIEHEPPSLEDEINTLRTELEKLKRDHKTQISIMTKSFNEILKETRSQYESERLEAVAETKRKQWCSNCWQEAKLHCCWQTFYCDNACQRNHWTQHGQHCINERSFDEEQG